MLPDVYLMELEMEGRMLEIHRQAAHLRMLREANALQPKRRILANALSNLGNQMINLGEWLQARYGECKEAAFELSIESNRRQSI